jgi:hypothetical protein
MMTSRLQRQLVISTSVILPVIILEDGYRHILIQEAITFLVVVMVSSLPITRSRLEQVSAFHLNRVNWSTTFLGALTPT